MAEANTSDGSADSDQDFDPSAEMLVDEYDDEKTLDEEEALESDASDDELNTLQKEGEMPLEDLLAMFGYKDGERVGGEPESEEEESDEEDEEEESVEEVAESCASKAAAAAAAAVADKPVAESSNKEPVVATLAPKDVPQPSSAAVAAPVPAVVPLSAEVKGVAVTPVKTPSPITRATPTPPQPPPRREHRAASTAHLLRSVSHASESSNSDSDEDFTLEEYWKKAAIVGHRTGKVLYLGVKNKVWAMCRRTPQGATPKEHQCHKNWQGSSKSMEQAIVVEGFKKSIELHGIKYTKLIADGDSSTYRSIVAAAPYGNQQVEKIKCRNHLLRNYAAKIREIAQKKWLEKMPPKLKNSFSKQLCAYGMKLQQQ
ncbi:hypothetical protein V5799_020980 [Amblyomma americanum]|uniref:Mutator-like transposase domain-containing protein n=1 Tax=Amblyomma americanum TaxID=6943 RepID=A0AAQ4FPQ6_AMBAM